MNRCGGGGAVGRMQGLLGCSCVSYIKMSHEGSNSDQLEVLFCVFPTREACSGQSAVLLVPIYQGHVLAVVHLE